MLSNKKFVISLLALGACLPPLHAEEVDTLKKISTSKTIAIGHRESAMPFSYFNEQQEVIGYSQDLLQKIVDAIQTELKLPELTVQKKLVTAQNRIPLILNGEISIECGVTTNNSKRREQVDFSNTFFIASIRMLVKKGSSIKEVSNLVGKNVATTQGTTSEQLLNERNIGKDGNQQMRLILAKEHGQSFLNLEQGKAVAFVMDDVLLASERAKAKKPDAWEIVGPPLSQEAYGCILPKGDKRFKQVVDNALEKLMVSGEIATLYKKWFESPIPPKNVNLNYPMSEDMKVLFSHPNDKSFD
jgi:glutamate/aspartate transport system substrate-binding protein